MLTSHSLQIMELGLEPFGAPLLRSVTLLFLVMLPWPGLCSQVQVCIPGCEQRLEGTCPARTQALPGPVGLNLLTPAVAFHLVPLPLVILVYFWRAIFISAPSPGWRQRLRCRQSEEADIDGISSVALVELWGLCPPASGQQ